MPAKDAKAPKPAPDAHDLVDEIIEHDTLDLYYGDNPERLSDEDLKALIDIERRDRAAYIEKGE